MTALRILPASLAQAYGLTPADFSFVAEVQNTVFGFVRNDAEYVLRLTPETHRSFDQVEAEMDWLRHLTRQGLRLSAPLPAKDGASSRRLEGEGRTWTAAAFTKAPGGPFQKAFFAATREAVITDKPFIEDNTMAAVLESIRS